jgi:hypothetical protein
MAIKLPEAAELDEEESNHLENLLNHWFLTKPMKGS